MKKPPSTRKSRRGAERFWTFASKKTVEFVEDGERKVITLISAASNDDQIGIFRMNEWQRMPKA